MEWGSSTPDFSKTAGRFTPVTPARRKLRQEDHQFRASLSYLSDSEEEGRT